MEDNTLIKVEHLSKKFTRSLKRSMLYGTLDSIRVAMSLATPDDRLRPSEFWALKDVNFELKRGERLGILGMNGSGKTTLLRILTKIFPPDSGKVHIRGRVGALIAVGAGFHPHMSGRENIFLNGTILGMSHHEIRQKIDAIIDFSEIPEGAIDAPVSTYSSGMTARLGFAIAVHTEPDILLVDEVLSVGDMAFNLKCQKYIAGLKKKNISLIFVSHNITMMQFLCDRAIWLEGGVIKDHGTASAIVNKYRTYYNDRFAKSLAAQEQKHYTLSGIDIHDIYIRDKDGISSSELMNFQAYQFGLEFSITTKINEVVAGIQIEDSFGNVIHDLNTDKSALDRKCITTGRYSLQCRINIRLKPGIYTISFQISDSSIYDRIYYGNYLHTFTVKDQDPHARYNDGFVVPEYHWDLAAALP